MIKNDRFVSNIPELYRIVEFLKVVHRDSNIEMLPDWKINNMSGETV